MRRLKANEIEVRIDRFLGQGRPSSGTLLLYIDARTAQQLLDEEYGSLGWKVDYQFEQDGVIANISVYDKEKGEWVTKSDVGAPAKNGSVADPKKTMVSDAFKRASVVWGCGRELYCGPKQLMFKTDNINMKEYNGKWNSYDEFAVKGIDYDEDGNITALNIYDLNTGKNLINYDVRPEELTADEVKKYEKMFKDKGIKIEDIVKAFDLKAFKDIKRSQVKQGLSNPAMFEPKGEEAVQNLPNTQKGIKDTQDDKPGDFMNIPDEADDEGLPFK